MSLRVFLCPASLDTGRGVLFASPLAVALIVYLTRQEGQAMKKALRVARSRKGGYTRAARLSAERRQEIARLAARARWARGNMRRGKAVEPEASA